MFNLNYLILMNEVIEVLMNRDGINREQAESLVKETYDEIISNPHNVNEIMEDNLGLEPDYLQNVLNYIYYS